MIPTISSIPTIPAIPTILSNDLPHDILEHIYGFLRVSEVMARCACVSKSWNRPNASWERLVVLCKKRPDCFDLIIKKSIPQNIHCIRLSGRVSNDSIRCIGSLVGLKHLALDCRALTDQGFVRIGLLDRLDVLVCDNSESCLLNKAACCYVVY